jgi:hypothetical protein
VKRSLIEFEDLAGEVASLRRFGTATMLAEAIIIIGHPIKSPGEREEFPALGRKYGLPCEFS